MATHPPDSGRESRYFNELIVLASRKHGLMIDFMRLFTFQVCQGAGGGCRRPRYSPTIDLSVKRSRPTTPNGWSNTSADKRTDEQAWFALCQQAASRQGVGQDIVQVEGGAE